METESGTVTVSKAFQEHLRRLCLHEFPCGLGSWNRTRFSPENLKSWKGGIPKVPENVPPEEENVECLLRLVRSTKSPWAQHKDSTMEDQYLRELAIQNPLIIGDAFLFSYFTSLRVVNKGVTLIDEDLLKFLKLEELILSANRIRAVEPMNLPPTLKVLELYGNEMTSIQCLCSHPPPALQHLGVGHNKLIGFLESQYITANYWPNLVSLDLGYNDLTELRYMVAGLCTLPQLRLLVLQGNPLALVPHYRGYTIDCLPQLYVLDDISVSPEERHLFQGISCKLGSAKEEAHLIVTVKNVTGVLDSSLLDPEPTTEGPYTVYSYYVTYNFVKEEKDTEKEYANNIEEVIKPNESPPLSTMVSREGINETEIDPRLKPAPGSVLFNTLRKPWSNIIDYDYNMKHTLKDLVPLKAFLLLGTQVSIVEEKFLGKFFLLQRRVPQLPRKEKAKKTRTRKKRKIRREKRTRTRKKRKTRREKRTRTRKRGKGKKRKRKKKKKKKKKRRR
ncbi:leucine-rich repeat-containing protein 43 isoform X4 [Notamacropus eugenii]|uniref:leucine-rich repeat-containing protein 43 isoform X4 n=1 Tax=Notamacropus eugenii TaxID=9315 RepID=UPI003B66C304